MRARVRSLASFSGLRIRHCHELWCSLQTWLRSGLLCLWHRPAGTAPIRPLAWKLPYAVGVVLKRLKTNNNNSNNNNNNNMKAVFEGGQQKKKKKKKKKKKAKQRERQKLDMEYHSLLYSMLVVVNFSHSVL